VNINRLVAKTPEASGQAYNCASGIRVTIKELADAVLAHYGKQHLGIVYKDWKIGDIKVFDVSNEKVLKLGMKFETPFKQGLARTLDWLSEDVRTHA
jgi:UDP-glucose 4-epimerase